MKGTTTLTRQLAAPYHTRGPCDQLDEGVTRARPCSGRSIHAVGETPSTTGATPIANATTASNSPTLTTFTTLYTTFPVSKPSSATSQQRMPKATGGQRLLMLEHCILPKTDIPPKPTLIVTIFLIAKPLAKLLSPMSNLHHSLPFAPRKVCSDDASSSPLFR